MRPVCDFAVFSSIFDCLETFFLHLSESIFFFLLGLSVQLIDLSEVFLSTEIEYLTSVISQPGGSIQAICVPSGAVGIKPCQKGQTKTEK